MTKQLFTLERFYASDGVELCGLLSAHPTPTRRGLIHIHGLAGNFYEQHFVDTIVTTGVDSGRQVLVFNNRGHDYLSDALATRNGQRETLARGGAHERLDEALLDIIAAVDLLRQRGIDDIVITAHSTGAVKAALYLMGDPIEEVRGFAMLSPSDDVGIQWDNVGERFEPLLQQAREQVAEGSGSDLMPPDTFFYPIDAQAYMELFDPAGQGNVFDVDDHGNGLRALGAVTVPALVVLGSEDIAVVGDKAKAAAAIVAALGSSATSDWVIIDGAGHDYAGHEPDLGTALSNWLRRFH